MAHTTIFNMEVGIIETKLEGVITFNEVKEVIADSIRLAREHKCLLWLTDYTGATTRLSTLEIYAFPGLFSEAASSLQVQPIQIKRAVVIAKADQDYSFAKTLALNRGQSLELFDDVEEARIWLANRKP